MKYGSYHTKKPIFYKSNRNNSRTISTFHSSKNISILVSSFNSLFIVSSGDSSSSIFPPGKKYTLSK